jgi:hypothetical protein
MDVDFGGLDRIILIVDRSGWTGQVVNLVGFDIKREGDVMADKLKERILKEMQNISLGPGVEVIYAQDIAALIQKAFTEMGANESRASCYKNTDMV